MFGADDKKQTDNKQPTNDIGVAAAQSDNSLVTAPPDPVFTPSAPPLNDAMASTPTEPAAPVPDMPSIVTDSPKDEVGVSEPPSHPVNADEDELVNIKQQALHSLAPLVNQLDQTPEEKFKTTMMLIQASDNAALIKDAYEAAGAITDEKARAQALLDVVNEINYFTQHQNPE